MPESKRKLSKTAESLAIKGDRVCGKRCGNCEKLFVKKNIRKIMSMQKGFVKTDLTIEKGEKQPICRRMKWEKIPAKGIFWKLVGKRLEVVLFCLRRDSCNYTDCNI